jgi:phage/plasmid-like protein (TIGR03299 family)
MTAADAMRISQQDWEVVANRMWARNPVDNHIVQIPGMLSLFRSDNGAFLSAVSDSYGIIQNVRQFEAIDVLLQASVGAHYETAGVLGSGEVVWASARIPEADMNVAGDKHETFLLASTSHDASQAFILKLTSVCVVCNNTLSAALRGGGSFAKVRHTTNANVRINAALDYLSFFKENAKDLESRLNVLAQRHLSSDTYQAVMDSLFPVSEAENKAAETRRENILQEIVYLYDSNNGNVNPSVRGTGYNLLNSITEYIDHVRGAKLSATKKMQGYTVDRARAESALFGTGEAFKNKALEVILEKTAGLPTKKVLYASKGGSTGS